MDEISYSRSLDKRIEEQVKRWQADQKKKYKKPIRPVITISRLPGAMAGELAGKLAKDLDIDLFDQEIVEKIAESADKSKRVVESLDEQDRGILEEWITALGENHMWSYEYLQHLTNAVGAIGAHGHAVIVGRGASFILPREVCLRVLVVAPLLVRIKNVMIKFKVSDKEASRQVMRLDAERKAFIQKYFHADMMDPTNYDLVINTHNIDIDLAARLIKETFNSRHWYDYSAKKK
ncbi:MAG TPA: cytidylate kinase-like family protein [Syntrophales bacterium]|jgi:cytidylate kinase|nr:cytidylate kinase-like family protein [Syntrophales bacterium]HOX95482.1 cytidylate kinase-like family protein [Syntrophales bacterium]HPI58444.1 cytidylate kinase-like family protein [Syntrophales bacterium]HPN25944.1 cytidylate kinase-like family protein [Syntrophales bacterium]HQM28782.1 cytidylate kinase-like family protein [Syntrophales bacterium]